MNKLLLVLLFFLFSVSWAESQTILQGQVLNKKGLLMGVKVVLFQQDSIIQEAMTDTAGNYRMVVDSGNYNVEFSYPTCMTQRVEGMQIFPEEINVLNAVLSAPISGSVVSIQTCTIRMIHADETSGGQTFTAAQIRHMF